MEEIMQSNAFFMVPLVLCYGIICGMWFLLDRVGWLWEISPIRSPEKPWTEFFLSIIAAIAILAVGQLYSRGWLLPGSDNEIVAGISWMFNNVIIFSPLWLTVIIRKQSLNTLLISGKGFLKKVIFGLVASAVGILIFVSLRNELGRFPEIFGHAFTYESLINFPAVFFENVALAFLFVRFRWAVGSRWAILIPALLFAVAHIPGSLAEGDPWGHILYFAILTSSLTVVILYTAYRSRDIIWLGFVHYLVDVAIKAF
ncbi:MAG: hypothetical protein R8G66_08910 [Cytophagales bacterium]|nr:hypothetical protein [Cytophagales bacterium]